ncbi:hypothetical protein PVK06_006715 [Gossypium arboreum]|uniref:ATP synthase F1 complex delta/epsilon subunit N-terminal domain-containing protein n=1 Tax=Gossypium arboreum TaxID=29729 RepID=A0ABR0QFI1_GOSAR|nr:hypothetical protein PVK06_006715 [Gossypium arboreum]
MKGSGPPVATVLVASTVALTSSSSAEVQHVSFSPTSSNQVDMVIVPATTGQMGVLPGHVATIAEFKPGVLSVHEGSETTKYFVSSGFCFYPCQLICRYNYCQGSATRSDRRKSCPKKACRFHLEAELATTELEKAEAQIGIDVHSALNSTLTG